MQPPEPRRPPDAGSPAAGPWRPTPGLGAPPPGVGPRLPGYPAPPGMPAGTEPPGMPPGAVPPGRAGAQPGRRPTSVTLAGVGDLVAALPLLLTPATLALLGLAPRGDIRPAASAELLVGAGVALLVLAAMVVCGILTLRGRPAGRIGTYLLGCLFGLVGVLGCLGAVVRSFVVLAPVNVVGGFAAVLLVVTTVGPVVLLSLPSSREYFDPRRRPTASPPPVAAPR